MRSPSALGVAATPDLAEFRELARDRRVIPVVRRLLADGLTAVGMFHALCQDRAGTFLLESAEPGRTWSRYSFIGVRSAAMLTEGEDGQARWVGRAPRCVPREGRTVDVLRGTLDALRTVPLPGMPPLTSGLVGFLGYDTVRAWERVPDENPDPIGLPTMGLLLATDLAVVDHGDGSVLLVANAINYDDATTGVDEAWHDAVARLDRMAADLARAVALPVSTWDLDQTVDPRAWTSEQDFCTAVSRAQEHIRAGDAFQVVLSRRFSVATQASALDVYRVLRTANPSPYMYLLRIPIDDGLPAGDASTGLPTDRYVDIVGSSPEALVTVQGSRAVVHPIAGTRRRGSSTAEDLALGEELLADPKERAEHLMLVDLARNDLGRVCVAGTVEVVEFMQIERYSHVMHLVSTVTGELLPRADGLDALRATFPAGTLSGAPKPMAMAIIDALEPWRRGLYGGCVGYFDFAGNADTAIAIRTALLKDGIAYVQAGAGVVADSIPALESAECVNKAAAVLHAITLAGSLRSLEDEAAS